MDELNQKGGGTIIIPEGTFLTGNITLKSNVALHLKFGSVLLGSTDPYDYLDDAKLMHFINAENASHIGIMGEGTIDGQDGPWH